MQAHLKCKLRLLALALVTSLRDVTLNVGSFSNHLKPSEYLGDLLSILCFIFQRSYLSFSSAPSISQAMDSLLPEI